MPWWFIGGKSSLLKTSLAKVGISGQVPLWTFFTLFTHVTSLTDFGHFSQNADSNVTYLVGSCYIFPSMCTNIRRSQYPVNLSKNYAHSQNVCNRYLYNSIQLYWNIYEAPTYFLECTMKDIEFAQHSGRTLQFLHRHTCIR